MDIAGVYIEDTDCYEVVFYANYFAFFEKALQEALGHKPLASLLYSSGLTINTLKIENGKYALAARLGDPVTIKSKLLDISAEKTRWEQSAVLTESGKLLVAAEIEMGFANPDGTLAPLPESLGFAPPAPAQSEAAGELTPHSGACIVDTPVTVFACDIGPTGLLTNNAVLRYFERNRTDFIGGAQGLKEVQEAGVAVVVARFTNAKFDVGNFALLGEALVAKSVVVLQRRDTTVVFQQMLYHNDRLIAQADITCVCISQSNMRICACPESIAAKVRGVA
eukprot:CAMPEP_0118956236 /NCGR_PEP_ID=MMETSP1169-20130426/61367_1 /TAXON_ID=36882 /ORGANISM="Pyramimonas obovata, Strain CCMP722" /LENGTH=279 /DNA_ID=CAMNT_0006904229 /DNA_START=255 /DNA_END=1094 /DNA_ORIENTATION=+